MNLYEIMGEISKAFDEAIDPETGEILSEEALTYLDQLEIERDAKIENIGCWIKNLNAEAAALKEEEKSFADRKKRAQKKSESLKRYLAGVLAGEKFSTEKVAISFRSSDAVEIEDEKAIPEDYIKTKVERSPDKTSIKQAIKAGMTVEGCKLVKNLNIQIK